MNNERCDIEKEASKREFAKVIASLQEKLGVRTFSWTKLLFLNYVYTEMDSFHPTIF